eukprot:CAMPEP_0174331680 /NCGR_PEP_ID=MMETSP0810-20121108/17690_1 /TAXON_ID=73025 ORGANISM="Eutreptiella gymnastica-like, Strain CCMP1594" /NCGR_SAMPLE_ID=MMETSP0810 /ASSEMBLY_ACC=CAM_ASM_000659 /LENGTH=172 /DNA_ID=CAMNT_0015447631 /DNA_START=113 /DNA_END=628 /DNA_ORIENTATION=-
MASSINEESTPLLKHPPTQKKPISRTLLATVMAGLIVLGACNFVSIKVMYASYGGRYAYFASQGVNVLYLVFGGMVLYPLMCCTNQITAAERNTPGLHRKFFIMGVLDCFGTFLAAIGNVYTPGQYQPLLNQTLIPLTLLFSFLGLGTRFRRLEVTGALLIMLGACCSVLPA